MIASEREKWNLFLEETEIDGEDLHSYAASAFAIELISNWEDCWAEGYPPTSKEWKEMMVRDITHSMWLLEKWKQLLIKKEIT